MNSLDRLSAVKLREALGQCTIGREVIVLGETTSTNDSVLERTSASTPEGLVVFAERQTAGRGQRGNRWESAAQKGLWLSILLRPRIDISKSAELTAWAANIIAQSISERFALPAKIKLPNDVTINGKKVAGVLVEMRAQKNAPHFAVLGVGINLNHSAKDLPEELHSRAISLAMLLDRDIDREEFAVALLRNLNRTYRETFGS